MYKSRTRTQSNHSPTRTSPQRRIHTAKPSHSVRSVHNTINNTHNKKSSSQSSQQSVWTTAQRKMSTKYDLAVIGGGSGGLAAAKEAAKHGKKVVLFDYVKPSPQGTKWGLGGTCVNVGCVPKKLMHYAATIGHQLHSDAKKYGFNVDPHAVTHDWSTMVETVQNHIGMLNFGYRNGLRSANVEYINALAKFTGPHNIEYTLRGKVNNIEADKILIATGGRPVIPDDVPGARDLAITSDDLFSLQEDPKKTLVIGASYIALECAGFLTALGKDVTVAVRSILLRGFDRDCADKIGEIMKCTGTKFAYKLPKEMVKDDSNNMIKVTFSDDSVDYYNTVLYATGRYADTPGLNLDAAGLVCEKNGKFVTDDNEATNVSHIYAIGDILQGKPELTPVAIRTGELLARRLFANSKKKMDWKLIPTTVFTPAEYGAIGYSEDDANKEYGDDVRTYLFEFTTLEHAAAHREKVESQRSDEYDVDMPLSCFAKLVTLKSQNEKIIGFHFVGPNAGEITQGFAVALRLGATKSDFDDTVGIHPTDAESFMSMDVTRESGLPWQAAGGCGGGKCG